MPGPVPEKNNGKASKLPIGVVGKFGKSEEGGGGGEDGVKW